MILWTVRKHVLDYYYDYYFLNPSKISKLCQKLDIKMKNGVSNLGSNRNKTVVQQNRIKAVQQNWNVLK